MSRHVRLCTLWYSLLVIVCAAWAIRAYATATGSLRLSGTVTGMTEGSVVIGPLQIAAGTAVYQRTTPALSSGDNTISVPTGATCCLMIFPAANTQAVKLKGAAGDTGVTLNKIGKDVVQLDSGQTTFILNAAGSITGSTLIFF